MHTHFLAGKGVIFLFRCLGGDTVTAHMEVTWHGTTRLPHSWSLIKLSNVSEVGDTWRHWVSHVMSAFHPHDLSEGKSGTW